MAEENDVANRKPAIDYSANSQKSKDNSNVKGSKPPVESVVSGEAVLKKKSIGRKITESFSGDDANSVGTYVLFEVIIPAAKTMLSDSLREAVDRLLFGSEGRRRPVSHQPGRPQNYTPYNRVTPSNQVSNKNPNITQRGRQTHDFSEVVFPTRVDAEDVLEAMRNLLEQYTVVSVTDFYRLCNITGSFADEKYGWDEIRGSNIQAIRDGFILNLPAPSPIK